MGTIQVVTFDAGGALLYPFPSVGAVYAEIAARYGINANPQQLQTQFRKSWSEAHQNPRVGISDEGEKTWWRARVQRTFRDHEPIAAFDALFEELWQAFAEPSRWKLHDGVRETLSDLRNKGFQLAILSNWDRRLRPLLKALELMEFFEHCVISSEVGFEKPHPEIFRAVERHFHVPPQQILHVGDSEYHDAQGAKAAGWNWLLVTHRQDPKISSDKIQNLNHLLEHDLIR